MVAELAGDSGADTPQTLWGLPAMTA